MAKPQKQINILDELRQVLDIEIEGLETVRSNLTDAYATAVETIAACDGHVFVTGVGKSGIVANKIAATLRSTGTPATYMHSGEAHHGDVGMIKSTDLVLAIGKSGETAELNSLLRILKKSGIPIISITSNAHSQMAALSDIVLDLRVPREACPLNLAPTTSTTAALAIGDAIAVALMKLKGISEDDFARHHPGGQIGKRLLLTVADVMRTGNENPVIHILRSVKEMIVQITAFRVGAISVIDDEQRLIGLVTDYDVRKALESERSIFELCIADLMNPNPAVMYSDAKAADALEFMRDRNKPTAVVPVIDNDRKVVGMIHIHDLITAGL
jgi:arabinose-5-phosphate isomerase